MAAVLGSPAASATYYGSTEAYVDAGDGWEYEGTGAFDPRGRFGFRRDLPGGARLGGEGHGNGRTGNLGASARRSGSGEGAAYTSSWFTPYLDVDFPGAETVLTYRMDYRVSWDVEVAGDLSEHGSYLSVAMGCGYACDGPSAGVSMRDLVTGVGAREGSRSGTLLFERRVDYPLEYLEAGVSAVMGDPNLSGRVRIDAILSVLSGDDVLLRFEGPDFLSRPARPLPVPLPPAAPLLVAGLAALGLLSAWRRRPGAAA